MSRQNFSSGAPWEPLFGYSRAVRNGPFIQIAGTTASNGGTIVGQNDLYRQSVQCLKNIESTLSQAGAKLSHVVRTRMYVTDISQWEQLAKAHREFFGEIRPASSLVEVSALISPEMLVEIEADAYVGKDHPTRAISDFPAVEAPSELGPVPPND